MEKGNKKNEENNRPGLAEKINRILEESGEADVLL
jgi:hypothetical protein